MIKNTKLNMFQIMDKLVNMFYTMVKVAYMETDDELFQAMNLIGFDYGTIIRDIFGYSRPY
jgi:hypothetical protein